MSASAMSTAENKLLVNPLSTCTPLVALPSSVPRLHSILGAGKMKTLGKGVEGNGGGGGADAPQPRPPTQMQRRQCTLGKGYVREGRGELRVFAGGVHSEGGSWAGGEWRPGQHPATGNKGDSGLMGVAQWTAGGSGRCR